ncbi:MAG: hypothetical protein AAFX87_28620 [Bacteroidota bacterium]
MEETVYNHNRPEVAVEDTSIVYRGRTVKAKKLKVSSTIPMSIQDAWENVQTPELLQFVAKGMIAFKSTDGGFPAKWQVGKTYGAKMRIFGFLPFGGTHYLKIEGIDHDNYEIATKEWDNSAKVWNHDVKMETLSDGSIHYQDIILIYGGLMTGFITAFARIFYQHRQRRWQIVAKKNLSFG